MNLRDLHYAWPTAINLAFAAFFFLLLFFLLHHYRKRILSSLNLAFVPRSPVFYSLQCAFFMIAWLACIAALMQPLANGHYPEGNRPKTRHEELRRPAHEVIFLVDASASMNVADMHNGQTRLQYVQQLADETISELNGEQASLYAFTSTLIPLSPPTLDYLFVRLMLDQISINPDDSTGTDYIAVLAELRNRLGNIPATVLKTLVIFTDGGDTAIQTAGDGEKKVLTTSLLTVINDFLKLNGRTFTVGIGSQEGGKVPDVLAEGQPVVSTLNSLLLKQMANAGNGKYLEANDYTVIEGAKKLSLEINSLSKGAQGQDIENTVVAGEDALVYDHLFQIPLMIAITALLLALYLPEVRRLTFLFVSMLLLNPFQVQSSEIRPATVYSEAGQYAKAVGLIDEQSAGKLKKWQTAVLNYNKATIYLMQGEYDLALQLFNSIPLANDPPPLLLTSIKINLGITYLEKAYALRQLESPPYPVILGLYSQAIDAFKTADSIFLVGNDKNELLKIAYAGQAQTFQMSTLAFLTPSSLREGMPLLLLNISKTLEDLRFLERDWVEDKLKEKYLQVFKQEQEFWDPLWKTLFNDWISASDIDEEKRQKGVALFGEAEMNYRQAQKEMQQGLWQISRQHINIARDKINGALRILFGNDPIQDLLQMLLNSYKRISSQDIFNEAALILLQSEQEQVMSASKSEDLQKADLGLNESKNALKKGQMVPSKMYLQWAEAWVYRALAKLQPAAPIKILEDTINNQTLAGGLLKKRLLLANGIGMKEIWREEQEYVLQTSRQFLPAVLELQVKKYQGDGEFRCQARPWDEVLPLFQKGWEEAKAANDLLQTKELEKALVHEGRALVAWQEALALLKKPVKDHSSPCQGSAKQPKPQEKAAPEENEAQVKPKEDMQDILRVLQELNQDDQLPKTDQGIKNPSLRPW